MLYISKRNPIHCTVIKTLKFSLNPTSNIEKTKNSSRKLKRKNEPLSEPWNGLTGETKINPDQEFSLQESVRSAN